MTMTNPPIIAEEPDIAAWAPQLADEPMDSVTVDMTEMVTRVTQNTQIRLIRIGDLVLRLVPKISAIAMANLSKGVSSEDPDFNLILDATTRLVHKDDRAKFTQWLEDDEPDIEVVMSFMSKAMEIITGKA